MSYTIQIILNTFKNIDPTDRELLAAHVLGKSREFVIAHPEYVLTTTQEKKLREDLMRRATHEPFAHLVGHKEFFGLDFLVTKDTLVPRPETEMMVEKAIEHLSSKQQAANSKENTNSKFTIIDIGTGSGNIIVSLAKQFTNFNLQFSNIDLFGLDISQEALKIAGKNAKRHGVDKKIKFMQSDLLTELIKNKSLDSRLRGNGVAKVIILANLPYLSSEIYRTASPDVKKYEPKSALFSPGKGLAHYRKLLRQMKRISLSTKYQLPITAFFEISPEQKPLIAQLIKRCFPKAKISLFKDLAGKWRVVKVYL